MPAALFLTCLHAWNFCMHFGEIPGRSGPSTAIVSAATMLRWPRGRWTRGVLLGGTIAAIIVVMRHLTKDEWMVDQMAVSQFALLHASILRLGVGRLYDM